MIDFGLLLSMLAVIGVPSLAQRWWPLRTTDGASYSDLVILPVMVGLLIGRLANVALDAPGSFGRIGDLLIIRSGVDFWPGALVAVGLVAWAGRGDGAGAVARLADLAPLALLGYAVYESCCLFRDGCYGPASAVGLRPPGVATTMFPIGLAVALAVVGLAVAVRALATPSSSRPRSGLLVVVAAIAGVATVRAIASIWLPHVGEGLTRPHLTSIVVAAGSVPVLLWLLVQARGEGDPVSLAASEGPTG